MSPLKRLLGMGMVSVGLASAFVLTTPAPAEASIHEIIAALCRSGGEEVVPFGQNKDGQSFLRALQATGFLVSIEATATAVTFNFDPTVPASKFMSLGHDVVLEDAISPGVDVILSPGVVPDPNFPAHSHCANLRE